MNIYIIIPANNEEAFISKTLQSLVEQTLPPKKIIVVNDNSSDDTQTILNNFSKKYDFIESFLIVSKDKHEPGSKVVNAFNNGLKKLDDNYDVLCKFDADLIFPKNYLESIASNFKTNPNYGMSGGFCYVERKENWVIENLTNKDHIRGALKAYRRECFKQIGGLKNTMGWDTIDELLAQYHGWKINTDPSLHVKHLKPTGASYDKKSRYKQGEAFYKMRYGFLLTEIASIKLAVKKNSFRYYLDCIQGYKKSRRNKIPHAVSEDEGKFIRSLRWRNIKKKLF